MPVGGDRGSLPLRAMTTPSTTLSEAASKRLLAGFGLPFADERDVASVDEAVAAASAIGFPVVVKLCGDAIAHKTERGLVRLRLGDERAVRDAAAELLGAALPSDGDVSLLVAPMVAGNRELIAGMLRDRQFGPTVMLGVGGILAEAVADVVFRPAPLDRPTAAEMIDDLVAQKLLGPFRGDAEVDRERARRPAGRARRLAVERPDVASVDVNPLIVGDDGLPVAVDALVELGDGNGDRPATRSRPTAEQFDALFSPRGVLVTGASSHPGKFGFVSLHNLLAGGYTGRVFGTNLQGEEVLGVRTVADIADLPDGAVDLVFVCTPAAANPEILRSLRRQGRAGGVPDVGRIRRGGRSRVAPQNASSWRSPTSSGSCSPGRTARAWCRHRPSCAPRSSRPYPPAGRIAVASQSGNFVSSFMNLARATGVGISRAVSAGNAAAVSVADYLDFYADDPETSVGLAYIEGITDGYGLMSRLAGAAGRKPLVVLKGGATEGGARAAASHTGALAADDKMFDGACRAAGITRATTVEAAFEAAATFATQPLPVGPNVVVLTTAGGWGVVTADADHQGARARTDARCPTTCATRSTPSCRPAGAATTRSTAPVARRATRSPR